MTSMTSSFSLTVLTLAVNALLDDKNEIHDARLSVLATIGLEGSVRETSEGDVDAKVSGSWRASAASFTISACVFPVPAIAEDAGACPCTYHRQGVYQVADVSAESTEGGNGGADSGVDGVSSALAAEGDSTVKGNSAVGEEGSATEIEDPSPK